MLGGRILGEGADGCILEKPGWPCKAGSKGVPDPSDERYVSKLVPVVDTESVYLNLANHILGKDLSDRYLAGLHGECQPADKANPPDLEDRDEYKSAKSDIIGWKKTGMSCDRIKRNLLSGKGLAKDHKLMFISKYKESVSDWVNRIQKEQIPYKKAMRYIERAIPMFISILQKLFQGESKLIHMDLHTGNIFIKEPFEFGMADFGHCVFRHSGANPSKTFYGEFLINNVMKFTFYDGHFSQVPFEACLMNYCYRKHMDVADPYTFIQSWSNDPEVREFSASSTDTIFASKDYLLSILLKRPLFLTLLSVLQSIVKKLRRTSDYTILVESLNSNEKATIDFILTRYHMISPFNTISQDIMNVYQLNIMTPLKTFVLQSILAPYQQESSLAVAFKAVEDADMLLLWSDIVKGN